jgi:signal transduction histidine kinase
LLGPQELQLNYLDRWREGSALHRAAQEIGLPLAPAHRAQVVHEQLRMVLLHTRVGTLAATAFAMLLAWQLQDTVPPSQVRAWLLVKVLVAAARIALAHAYALHGAAGKQGPRWHRAQLALLALDGAVWGVAGWRLMGEAVPVAALGVAALDGVSCIATFGLQVRLSATVAYVLPMLLPMTLGLAQRSDDIAHFAAAGQLILAGLLLLTARSTSQQLAVGQLLRIQADTLVQQKDAALQLAHQQSNARTRFLAKVSHELRTPLHGILGLARLLHLEIREPAASRQLELIEASGTQLLGLINDLLEVSRIDAGHFTLQEEDFDLAMQLEQVADLFALRAADKGLGFNLQMRLPKPCWVHGDAARLCQVLNNLLANAVKFTRQGHITLRAAPGVSPERVCMTVIDTGMGIDEAEMANIFQPFHQADAGPATDGVGLGLTIAREIARAMGGDIAVSSVPGSGATFVFEARLPPSVAVTREGAPQQHGGRLPRLVLVAEDDEVNTLIVSAFLDSLGVRWERVSDGKQAVSRALRETDRPELVLMDCRMPVMDGLAASTEIRRQERTLCLPRVPILALTATTTDVDRQACLDHGMDDVIDKPFTLGQLAQAMRGAGRLAPPRSAFGAPPRGGAASGPA